MSDWSDWLRAELSARAKEYAERSGIPAYRSLGTPGVTLFPRADDALSHGTFMPASYAAIVADDEWKQRLKKPHTRRKKALPAPHNETACETDSCTSSDALLMNIFAYPGVITGRMATLLGVADGSRPAFGMSGLVPLVDGSLDATELDMQIGNTNVEAKLTEANFTEAPIKQVERYADLYDVFERAELPRSGGAYLSYQLIRNVLAIARHPQRAFKVLLDARRPDLLRGWWNVHGAIRNAELRRRCGFVLWQELAAAAPPPLREFLKLKYGL